MSEPVTTQLIISGIFGIAFLLQFIFGFGGAFIAVLALSMFLPMQTVVTLIPFTVIIGIVLNIFSGLDSVQWRPTFMVFLKAIPGLIIGGLLLNRISGEAMVLIASGLIFLYCIYSLFGKTIKFPPVVEAPLSSLAGFVMVVAGAGAMFVPIMVQRFRDPREFRYSLHFLWICLGLSRIPIYVSAGFITRSVIISALWSVPAVILASFLGRWIAAKIKPETFRRLLVWLLIVISAARIIMLIVELLSR